MKLDKAVVEQILDEVLDDEIKFLQKVGTKIARENDDALRRIFLAAVKIDNLNMNTFHVPSNGSLWMAVLYEALFLTEELEKLEKQKK